MSEVSRMIDLEAVIIELERQLEEKRRELEEMIARHETVERAYRVKRSPVGSRTPPGYWAG